MIKQNKDPEIAEFRDLLLQFTDRKPFWVELNGYSEFTKIRWKMWAEFVIKDGLLYRETTNVNTQEKKSGCLQWYANPTDSSGARWFDRWSCWYNQDKRSSR